jgi:hypothetical protein
MAEKTNAQKLSLKEGFRVMFVHPPENNAALLGPLPEGITLAAPGDSGVDFILAYIVDRKELEKHLADLKTRLKPKGLLWVAYYKGTARVKTDINRDTINAYAQTLGLEGVFMISLDEDWSAMRLKVVY